MQTETETENITLHEKLFIADYVITNNSVNVKQLLKNFRPSKRKPSLTRIMNEVCDYYSKDETAVTPADLSGSSRKAETVKARHVYMYLGVLYKHTRTKSGLTVSRDHATVIHAKRKIGLRVEDPAALWHDKMLAAEVAQIVNNISFKNFRKS